MTKEEIENSNVLIAEFMGCQKWTDRDAYVTRFGNINSAATTKAQLRFHKEWDWLMPVVEKIQKLSYVCVIYGNYCNILEKDLFTKKREGYGFDIDHYSDSIETVIDAVYMCVIEFIKYYNEKIKV